MTAKHASIALIMPNYNDGKYLHTSLSGLCEQTRLADEVIIVDDGSTDDSIEIIESYSKRCSNLKLLRNSRNSGVLFSCNRALAACQSEYIAILSSNDKIFPTFVEKSMERLEKYPSAGLCFSTYAVMDPETEEIQDLSIDPAHRGAFELQRYGEFMGSDDYRKQLRGGIIWMSSNTVILKKSAFLEAGGLRSQLHWHCDWFVNTVVALRHGVCVVPEVLSAIRARTSTSFSGESATNRKKQLKVIRNVIWTVARPTLWDIAHAFFRYPVLLTPLGPHVPLALSSSPLGWLFLYRYLDYVVNLNAASPDYADSHWTVRFAKWIFLRDPRPQPQIAKTAGHGHNSPTLSIIMSIYNGSAYLHESLTAICNQTRVPDELIIVDDGSTDDTAAIVREFSSNYAFIRILVEESNRGQLYCINRAFLEARGDYINWVAADDRIAPTFIEKTMACVARHPEAGICQSEYALFYESGGPFVAQSKISKVFDFSRMPSFMNPWRYREWLKDEIVWLSTNGAIVRRDVLLEMGAYHSEMKWHADWFSAQVAALRYGICIVAEPLAALRVRNSTYSQIGMNNHQQQAEVLTAIFDRLHTQDFRDVRRDFLSHSRVLSALSPSIYRYLLRRPSKWPYLIANMMWWCRNLSYRRSIDFSIWITKRTSLLSNKPKLGNVVSLLLDPVRYFFTSASVGLRQLLRVMISPFSVLLSPIRPHYRSTISAIENRLTGKFKRILQWVRRQISFIFSRPT